MKNFNFYTTEKAYGELYLQFPKVFLYSDKYKDLSDSSKIAYMVFKDRLQYSITNNWIDENNHVYFIFTNKELENLLNCHNQKVVKIKKELEEAGLLLQVKQGFNPRKKKNAPNRLYLADLEVEAHEVYSYQNIEKTLDNSETAENAVRQKNAKSLDNSGSVKITHRQDEAESLDNSGSVKITHRQDEAKSLDNSGSVKITHNQYKYLVKDIKDVKDQVDFQNQQISKQFSKNEKATEQELIEQYIEENELVSTYGDKTIQLVRNYSFNELEQFKVYIDKFYFGWKSAERDTSVKINPYEKAALHDELANTFKRVIIQFKQGKTKNINNYLYISLKNVFKDYAEAQQENNTNLPPVPLDSWLK